MLVKEVRVGNLCDFVKNSLTFKTALHSAGKGHT